MKPATRDEGPQAFDRFQGAMKGLLSVSRAELQRREAEYKKKAALQPKRGPKPKQASSSHGPAAV
jgi:hypothetical protein